MLSLLLIGCGSSEKDGAPAKPVPPASPTKNEQHRAACLPQEGGGIICQ
jgi:hypothetical protein